MIKTVYSSYFQKSRTFLYPLLGLNKKLDPGPLCTYIGWREIKAEDMKLICLYENNISPEFQKFQEEKLIRSPLYESHSLVNDHLIYIFNFSRYEKDWKLFLDGKYSDLSAITKLAIQSYHGLSSDEFQFIDTFLYPEKYFDLYSELLDIESKTLRQVGQLCNHYDREKEVLIFTTKSLELSEKTS